MYIILFLISFVYTIYGCFKYLKNSGNIKKNIPRFISWILFCVIFILLLIDLPFFVLIDRETDVRIKDINIIEMRKMGLITTYKDLNGNIFWSGAPIGHEEWLEYRSNKELTNICQIKYLPLTRIVVNVTEENEIVYDNLKDILTMSLFSCFLAMALLFEDTKERFVGKKRKKKR